ncbi:SulP family inorganic anion transporter [Paraburkholderia caballeronis]|uniref:High affinity sulphate transporter 1 n=1 Tax=Paraburkholderia caballeronis TaxID=416943 RepID=A0A1H7J1F2_9BURK|nr:SulP family inorganic anion transporter [Paraburkholderia caballeronis]PXW27603.1 high affinity sulfate transporter 1 [Paraburkholderia caballeronis]PXX03077.1 high affinity sulfate transporter 1 [Paraburkholderia caballeronis]RAK03802.1 high affinity sulfate transporter 1 [Paraburkholderia caballeronis]TDV21024.1 high affinity sulfate transporter 1 [Paraburkholderia caballeronis]TDV21453.1 high affinity sulfate transporter 1 [Paraburkholderia caballeronis]
MAIELLRGIRPLTRASALRDALAGATLASMNVPQLLGYARIAGMPAVTGLYTGFLPLIAFALFGASRHLVVAADSATATILAGRLSSMAAPSSAEYVALAGATALLTAGLLLLARIFRLGFLADFLSRTVLVGFLAGVGMQVGIAMLGDMAGLSISSPRTTEQVRQIVSQLGGIHWPTLGISALVAASILIFRRYRPHWPVPLVAVVGGIVASSTLHFAAHGIAVIGPVAGGLPSLRLPLVNWTQVLDLLPVAASCFAIIVAQSAATSRAFAERYRERIDDDTNLLGLAAANAAASLSGAFVVNGSLTQTAMADQAGARSQFAQLTFAVVVLVVLLFLSRWLQYLPHCVLASVVFTIACGLVQGRALLDMRHESPGELALAIVTALAVVTVGVENGILLAIALSLLRHVRHSYRPHTMMLAPGDGGRWLPVPAQPGRETAPGLIVYRFGADLFYANDHLFVDETHRLIGAAPTPVRWFVVDAAAITDIDYSAGRSVCDLCDELAKRGVRVIFARVNPYLRADMDRHRITPVVGAQNLFETLHEALAAVHPDLGARSET